MTSRQSKTARAASDAGQEALRQHEELRLILDAMPAMVWYKDRDNRILRANADAAASAGLTPGEMEGRSTWDLFPAQAAQYHRDDLEVIESGIAKLGIVEPLQTASGETRWVRTDKLPYRDAYGDIVGVIVFAVDITAQKRAEQALEEARDLLEVRVQERTAALAEAVEQLRAEVAQRQQTEERLDLALWATDLAMWDWDARTQRTVCDERWTRMLGYELDEVPDATALWAALAHPDDLAVGERAWHAHVRDGAAPFYESEQRVRTRAGDYRWVLARGKVVERDADGAALRMIGTNRDITAKKQVAEQARQRQAELAHLLRLQTVNCIAAELAHEINQPLGAIVNFANGLAARLRQGEPDRAAMLEVAERIGAQAMRAGTVLQRLRGFVRKDPPREEACDVADLLETAAALVTPEAGPQGVVVRLDVAAGLPPVLGDAIQFEQVVVNLLRNGLEAIAAQGGGSGTLTVSARRGARGQVDLCVSDSGGGVPPAVQGQLFEPFFTTKPSGLGMGLSISRAIVEAHGGRLWLAPAEAGGATFCISLPPADAAA